MPDLGSRTRRSVTPGTRPRTGVLDFLHLVRWLDGSPILATIEPYRRQILSEVLDTWDGDRIRYNHALLGRGKKNAKSLDLVLAGLFACLANDSVHGNEVYLVASDEGQAADDLSLTKKLIMASPHLQSRLVIRDKLITRKDGKGFITILPGQDVAGSHGKTYRFCGIDEIHTQRDWSLLEALALDPHRADSQLWITSYASIYHRPGIPLFDLLAQAKRGADPRMYLSWYAADFTTDPAAKSLDPESPRQSLASQLHRRLSRSAEAPAAGACLPSPPSQSPRPPRRQCLHGREHHGGRRPWGHPAPARGRDPVPRLRRYVGRQSR
jgi:hypothetical protein